MPEAQELQMKLVSLSVRLTQADRTMLDRKADKLGCSKSEYIRQLIVDREVKRSVMPEINREVHQTLAHLKTELIRQGVNLNQMVRVANAEGIHPEMQMQLAALIEANQQLKVDIGICKNHILMGKSDDRQN